MVEQLAVDLPLLMTAITAIIGVTVNILRGHLGDNSEDKTLGERKFITGLIAGVMTAISIAVTLPVGDTQGGIVGLFIADLIAGSTADFAMSKGKK